jgi:hypothetical protein
MSKPGRNWPCPCGSGIKYKKCADTHEAPAEFFQRKLSPGTHGVYEVEGSPEARRREYMALLDKYYDNLSHAPRGKTQHVCYLDDASFFGGDLTINQKGV